MVGWYYEPNGEVKMVLNSILSAIFLLYFSAIVSTQHGITEFPYEFHMFENFDLTKKVFLEEQKLVLKLRYIKSKLQNTQQLIQVKVKKFIVTINLKT